MNPLNTSGPYSFEMWTFYLKVVDLYFVTAVRPNPLGMSLACMLHDFFTRYMYVVICMSLVRYTCFVAHACFM